MYLAFFVGINNHSLPKHILQLGGSQNCMVSGHGKYVGEPQGFDHPIITETGSEYDHMTLNLNFVLTNLARILNGRLEWHESEGIGEEYEELKFGQSCLSKSCDSVRKWMIAGVTWVEMTVPFIMLGDIHPMVGFEDTMGKQMSFKGLWAHCLWVYPDMKGKYRRVVSSMEDTWHSSPETTAGRTVITVWNDRSLLVHIVHSTVWCKRCKGCISI